MAFDLMECSVASLLAAYAAGELSCEEAVRFHFDRIERYDRHGPELRALITLNPRAIEVARELDAAYKQDPAAAGPLHGVPLVLKDNYNTKDLPTSGGSRVLEHSQPDKDAFVVDRLRQAGAVIIGKANMGELARNATTKSSLGGQTKNPYDLTRTCGGSSGGTGAAIAANFAVLGTGSDTGQSTRSPASAACLVGVRPTKGLVSRSGVMPLGLTQDETGPITRSVADAATMLDIMAVYDPADRSTAFGARNRPTSYLASIGGASLRGARFGLLTDFLGTEQRHEAVNAVLRSAVEAMRSLGAEVIDVSIPFLAELTQDMPTQNFEFKEVFNAYLAALPESRPVRDLQSFLADGRFLPALRPALEADAERGPAREDPEYLLRLVRRQDLREATAALIIEHGLDALLYPHQRKLVALIGEEQQERNGVLSNATGFPAVTFPGGFTPPSDAAPLGVPVGIELLGLDWTEPNLLGYAHAFEVETQWRRPPLSVPPL